MKEVILDGLLGTLKAAPLILAVYVIMELVERALAGKAERKRFPSALTPLLGATAGLIPQCGFSVLAADMYSKRRLSAGALIAVFLATSDEAIPVLLGDISSAPKLLPLLVIKYALALAIGYVVHFLFPSLNVEPKDEKDNEKQSENIEKHDTCAENCDNTHAETTTEDCHNENSETHPHGCHNHDVGGESIGHALIHALVHTLTVLGFMLAVNLIVGTIVCFVGEDKLGEFMNRSLYLQPIFATIVGLIPSCAGSVAISRLYGMGALSLGGAVAGLSAGAGLGYLVLYKQNKSVKRNVAITAICCVGGIVAGTVINAIVGV